MTLSELERRALELARQSDFGAEAARTNAAIVEAAPANFSAWSRLGRCHLEQRQFDEAVVALRTALTLNPASSVVTNLLAEVRKRRALTPNAVERATTGFAAREFALLSTLPSAQACNALETRIDALFAALNASSMAERVVSVRSRRGHAGAKLFHDDSCHAGGLGHIDAYHYGGRWEAQLNIGWFGSPPWPRSALRAGLGFNCAKAARDADRDGGQERVLEQFERFQRTLGQAWKVQLAQWMGQNGGFLQYGDHPPALDLTPQRAVEWLLNCRNAQGIEWIFVGRWLFLDQADDAAILADRSKLVRVIDDTFRSLYPLWLGAYGD
jgi:tetratricopeptide (TPR) repeat protein